MNRLPFCSSLKVNFVVLQNKTTAFVQPKVFPEIWWPWNSRGASCPTCRTPGGGRREICWVFLFRSHFVKHSLVIFECHTHEFKDQRLDLKWAWRRYVLMLVLLYLFFITVMMWTHTYQTVFTGSHLGLRSAHTGKDAYFHWCLCNLFLILY